jgi:tetratricopeptide (TPR) repeat protein
MERAHLSIAAHGYRYKADALLSLKKAHETFSDEQAPIWIDHNKANLALNDGMTHYHLGCYKEALDSFSQTKVMGQDEVGRVEILIDEVMAEISRDDQSRDMEWCIDRWTQGIKDAKSVQSQQHVNEAIQAYATMCAVWPGEKRIQDLREYIVD